MAHLLIIEDDTMTREAFRDRIISMGHESEEARTVLEALEKLKQSAFDCVLLDPGIPVALEGRPLVENGRNLLGQIVAMTDAPSVIVISANGLHDPRLAVAMMEMGAATFIAKGLQDDTLEAKIKMVLERRAGLRPSPVLSKPKIFRGGTLIVTPKGLELCGRPVGGGRKNASMPEIVKVLAVKERERYRRLSGADIADAIGNGVTPTRVANAVKAFRKRCQKEVGARQEDVITSSRGGGYRLADWIDVKFSDQTAEARFESDKVAVLRALRRFGECPRNEIATASGVPEPRFTAVLGVLDEEGLLLLRGSGSSTVYSIKST